VTVDPNTRLDEELSRVLAPLETARQLPRRAFCDESFFQLDQKIFERSWLPVAHDSELEGPGRYVACDVAGEHVVVMRTADLSLAGFLDSCVHRGTRLLDAESGRLERLEITCPYHGLRYDLRGHADVTSCPSLRLPSGVALRAVRVDQRFGFVFVCLDPSTPALAVWMNETPPWLERASLHALRRGRRVVSEVRANWKLLVDNFQESHHFGLVHPSLEARTPAARSASIDLDGPFLGGTMTLAEGIETVSDDHLLRDRPLIAARDDARAVHDALLVPAWLTSLQPDYFLSYRLVPRAATLTTVIADIYFHAAAFVQGFDAAAVYSFWDRTNAEDRAICERQQRGLASPSFELGGYATTEDGMHAFDRRIARAYRALLAEGRS